MEVYIILWTISLVAETHLTKFLPDLLNRIHFQCVWRNKEQLYIIRNTKQSRFVPCNSVAAVGTAQTVENLFDTNSISAC